MLHPTTASRRLCHGFLDCLRVVSEQPSDPAATPTATPAAPATRNGTDEPFALLVVNGEVGDFLQPLWRHAAVRICADGGVNRVYGALPPALRATVLPDCIVGDMDSARPDVLQFYHGLGVQVVREDEQYSTDLHKAIRQLARILSTTASAVRHVVVYGAFGGRFDQLVGNLVSLHSQRCHLPADVQMMLLSEGNLAQLLPAGQHLIAGHPLFEGRGTHCGLMALQGEAGGVWTSGLQWDLQGQTMGWDHTMSTCNLIASDDAQVTVSIEHGQLVWTTEFSSSSSAQQTSKQPAAASSGHAADGG